MSDALKLEILSFWHLEDRGAKADGTPDIQYKSGYTIRLTVDNQRILFEETLDRNKVPVNPTQFLARRMAEVLATYLPQIDPGIK